jgi:pimeloyl-ACP methyl ester carboxylesterase
MPWREATSGPSPRTRRGVDRAEDPIELAARVGAVRPDATVAVLDQAGHTLPVDDADRVAPLLLEVFGRREVRSGP